MKTFFPPIQKGALFSPCRTWRYALWRVWDERKPVLAVIGVNPSTADEKKDDPTVRRCIKFALQWKYGGLYMLNLFGYRATDPRVMKAYHEPVGEDNDRIILKSCKAAVKSQGKVLAAWGGNGKHLDRDAEVALILQLHNIEVYCLGTTKDGFPNHPLYMPNSTKPVLYNISL